MSGATAFQPTAFAGFKKTDATEALQAENIRLRRLLAKERDENNALKTQLKVLSVALDKAVSQGYRTQSYDVDAARELLRNAAVPLKDNDLDIGDLASGTAIEVDKAVDSASAQDRQSREMRFSCLFTYDHDACGGIFCARFSPKGDLFATASFNKQVRVYDVFTHNREEARFTAHTMPVSHVSWSGDGGLVASASFDSTVKVWDVHKRAAAPIYDFASPAAGFMLCAEWSAVDPGIVFCSHSSGAVSVLDTRARSAVATFHHTCMVNSLQVLPSGHLLLGDRTGMIVQLDVRTLRRPAEAGAPGAATAAQPETSSALMSGGSFQVTSNKLQVSHVCMTETGPEEIAGRFLGVNAYDDVLRVYDRGSLATASAAGVESNQLVCELMGRDFRTNGYPIRSSFWVGKGISGGRPKPVEERSLDDCMLLASGSCQPDDTGNYSAYVFDVTDARSGGTGVLAQRLAGHTGIVYGVHAHNQHPLLISYSEDGSVKLWSGRMQTR